MDLLNNNIKLNGKVQLLQLLVYMIKEKPLYSIILLLLIYLQEKK